MRDYATATVVGDSCKSTLVLEKRIF